jgi:phosphoribosylaminoimidazolecarboxamide formyltransferase/IMP cyclohydrolase
MELKIKRALFSCSDKTGLVDLARGMARGGAELVATGKTAGVLREAGLSVTPIEKISGSPEAFQGRMKTLSFPVCSGILYRRGDLSDEADLKRLAISGIDAVVVNFYPFEQAVARTDITEKELVEEIDIGGPTLVRAAAKNSPSTLVLTDPSQYSMVIDELASRGALSAATTRLCASQAWDRVLAYDRAIAERFGEGKISQSQKVLRYGENPHQRATLQIDPQGPIDWNSKRTAQELSYNNIQDVTAAYGLASDLLELGRLMKVEGEGVVIVKHGNPCGVAWVPSSEDDAQKLALERAWAGDPVSSFGGVVVFTGAITQSAVAWLSTRFVEVVAAPGLGKEGDSALAILLQKRKNLKGVPIHRFGECAKEIKVLVPGGVITQTADLGLEEELRSVTEVAYDPAKKWLGIFGVAVCRALKSNAIALVREVPGRSSGRLTGSGFQLVGAGQGQPNRVEALEALAVPRAKRVLSEAADGSGMGDLILVSDAFFPFRDTVDVAFRAGLRVLIQPGGSIKDSESIQACNEHGMAMAFTGVRHFRH